MLRPFGHPVARCCDMLRGVRCCWLKFENDQIFYATFVDVASCCSCLARFEHVAPNSVAICCVQLLQSFGWSFINSIGHVRYINILTWLRGFRVKLLYLVLFSLYSSLYWELRDNRNLKNFLILARKPRSHVRILVYRKWPIYARRYSLHWHLGYVMHACLSHSVVCRCV